MPRFHTIGHSTHSTADFIALLQQAGIRQLIDIRTVPASRANPQFGQEALAASLATADIGYCWLRELGGLRPKSKTVPRDCNGFWQNASFHNYADYALGPDFDAALAELIRLGRAQACAIMCAEAVWWRCHRRIVSDYLLARGHEVVHILGRGHLDAARLTPGSIVLPDLRLCYPAPGTSAEDCLALIDPSAHPPATAAQLTNPAAAWCLQQGGRLEIIGDTDGEHALCHLPDGTVIEEWALFRRDHP